MSDAILTLNAGSSSLKFALFAVPDGSACESAIACLASGQIEGIGAEPHLTLKAGSAGGKTEQRFDESELASHGDALRVVLDALFSQVADVNVVAVGHRVVHGGDKLSAPQVVDQSILDYLTSLAPLAPLHQPHNVSGIAAAHDVFPDALQVACLDTAFHRTQPWVSQTFALPRDYYDQGVRRYGFHGLSYEFVSRELARVAPEVAAGRVVIAHLGNGASMCAVSGGKSVASTMGFSALDGLPMGTRCGQIDPGVLLYLMAERGIQVSDLEDLLYRKSGLTALSRVSHDMREIEGAGTQAAEEAIEYFAFRIRRELGSLAAALGGLDGFVFCGGIGENSSNVRARVCEGLAWLGIVLDPELNADGNGLISAASSRVPVYVIETNEEIMIAQHTLELLRA